jgi:hypothetical protein
VFRIVTRLWAGLSGYCGLLSGRGKTFLGTFGKLQKATSSSIMSVRLSPRNIPAPTRRILMKFDI